MVAHICFSFEKRGIKVFRLSRHRQRQIVPYHDVIQAINVILFIHRYTTAPTATSCPTTGGNSHIVDISNAQMTAICKSELILRACFSSTSKM